MIFSAAILINVLFLYRLRFFFSYLPHLFFLFSFGCPEKNTTYRYIVYVHNINRIKLFCHFKSILFGNAIRSLSKTKKKNSFCRITILTLQFHFKGSLYFLFLLTLCVTNNISNIEYNISVYYYYYYYQT